MSSLTRKRPFGGLVRFPDDMEDLFRQLFPAQAFFTTGNGKTDASYENGVLEIRLKKSESQESQKIRVKSG